MQNEQTKRQYIHTMEFGVFFFFLMSYQGTADMEVFVYFFFT